jgi:CheY-specific phosphatase CheX
MAGENDLFFIEAGRQRPQEETLAKVVSSTFEKIGFMEARLSDEEPVDERYTLSAVIDILSPLQATIFFSAPRQLAWDIAENLYGLEDMTLEVVADMMSELLNTITGSLLSEIMPTEQFDLSIPTSCDQVTSGQARSFVYHFNIDNKGIITIVLNDKNS